jgi:hypothetical protein
LDWPVRRWSAAGKDDAPADILRRAVWPPRSHRRKSSTHPNYWRLPIQNKGKLLAELAVAMPTKAAECLTKILEGDKDGLGVLSWRDHVRALFSATIYSGDQAARARPVKLIQNLGRRGYAEFRDFLPI